MAYLGNKGYTILNSETLNFEFIENPVSPVHFKIKLSELLEQKDKISIFKEKVKVVNKSFGSSSKPGYETDRGIIQLKYGAPTERIIVNNEDGAYPYEIWQYNNLPKNPNALFLFYKPGIAVTQYDLLHTTVLGEVRNKQWRNNLYLNGTNADPLNSKAEFYIGTR